MTQLSRSLRTDDWLDLGNDGATSNRSRSAAIDRSGRRAGPARSWSVSHGLRQFFNPPNLAGVKFRFAFRWLAVHSTSWWLPAMCERASSSLSWKYRLRSRRNNFLTWLRSCDEVGTFLRLPFSPSSIFPATALGLKPTEDRQVMPSCYLELRK